MDDENLETTEDLNSTPVGASPSERARTIGPFHLLRPLGTGGMGEVWLAEQSVPVRRQVALKIIKEGMDTRQVVARFEAERQALAMMNHPAIAMVFEAGATPAGRPYFAMEYVPGVPIVEHCDRHRLTVRQRLGLFTQVCEGVQHAHQKSVIHRDLKPSNVLVSLRDDRPEPKIIDFGIAKATAAKLTELAISTQVGTLVGTPAYMSPEQADLTSQDIDTRTDVYSLGVMLHELLVGVLPHDPRDLQGAGFLEMTRRIREDDVLKPSARLSTLGAISEQSALSRRTTLSGLRRDLSGDLDWIILKALEKDRGRRYSSPQDLAADIERHLTDRPVLASPPSAMYQARKFVQRHTWGVMAAASAILMLAGFAVVMTLQAGRIAAQRDAAEKAKVDLESVVQFQAGMLSATDPQDMGRRLMRDLSARVTQAQHAGGKTENEVKSALVTLETLLRGVNATDLALGVIDEDILGSAVATLTETFGNQPLIDARLRETIGEAYWKLGRLERAEAQLVAVADTQRRVLGDEHPDTLEATNRLASLYQDQGRFAEAESMQLVTLELRKRVLGEDHADTLKSMNNLASVYYSQGRYAEVESLFLRSLQTHKRLFGDESRDTLTAKGNLAALYLRQGRIADAEPLLREVLDARKRVLGDDDPETLSSQENLATLYQHSGRYAEAEPLYRAALETHTRLLGNDHPQTLESMNNMAILHVYQRRYDEAEVLFLRTLETRRRTLGDEHQETARSLYNLACFEGMRGNRGKSMDWLRQSVEAGWLDVEQMSQDSTLDPLHGPEFDGLVARARANAARQRATQAIEPRAE